MKMKKILLGMAVALTLTACNENKQQVTTLVNQL